MTPVRTALLLLLALAPQAAAEPVTILAEPVPSFARLSSAESFGPFAWRGGLTLSSPEERFGGLSGLVLGPDCEELLAVSDRGNWLSGRLSYEGGRLSGFAAAEMTPVLDSKGRPQRNKAWGDAEALARLADGRIALGFESRVRFGTYDVAGDGLAARFRAVPHPKEIDSGPENAEVESLGQLPDGRFIAISEGQFDEGGKIRAWAWKGRKAAAFTLARFGDYRVTDLAVTADGDVLTLERRFTSTSLPGMALRRFPASRIEHGASLEPELLLEVTAPLHVIDNMEGLALCERDGETRVTLMSDDNFNRSLQSTVLLQFAYRP
ncbi:esterase-like activity of phytase family protein [Aestuariivirga sp.]|uniref:esterase-like activity of phytase family protein n=1 Tax=Aestuariivirga sp. TaxID=2650926 RepID=UPI00391DB91D